MKLVVCLSILSFYLIFTPVQVNGHSWLACTDYAEKNAGTWDASKCRGFPRNAHVKARKDGTFGIDTGYDHRPGETNVCNFPYDSTSYTRDHPRAVYYPGQQVVLVHPMKNHGADGACGSIWIPDAGSWLFAVRTSGTNEDPNMTTFRNNQVFDLGRSPSGRDYGDNIELGSVYPKPGYGNAPNFCDNTDKAMATYSFNVPRNLQPGLYTFVWMWSFNSENDRYTTCFEVDIVANKRARNTQLRGANITDLTEPCGGLTSNPNVMGNSNPGCTRPRLNVDVYAAISGAGPTAPPPSTTQRSGSPTPQTEFWERFTSSTQQTRSTTQRTQPTRSTIRRTQTTRSTTQAPAPGNNGVQTVHMSIPVHMQSTQFSGEIWLPLAGDNVIRRYIAVDFACDIDVATFWNSRTISNNEEARRTNHYDLVQRGAQELELNQIFYHVSFFEGCDLSLHPPVARLVQEDFL